MGKRWIVAFVNTIPSHYTLIHSHIQSCFRSSKFLPTSDRRIVSRDPCIAQYLFYFFLSLFLVSCFFPFSSSINVAQILHYSVFILCCALHTHTKTTAPHPFQHSVCDAYARAEWLKHHSLQCIVFGPAELIGSRFGCYWLLLLFYLFAPSLCSSLSFSLNAHCY